MSVLDTPRVYFRGQMTWDPIVTNNFPQLYDLATSRPVLGTATAAEYRERVRQTVPQGNWNPHGTHRSTFVDTFVSGVDRGDGVERDDPLVGVPVAFTGMLVDLDPYGATSSQLFFDVFSCGIEGGSRILAPHGGPVVARRLNFSRNTTYEVAGVASVVWQTSFPTRALVVQPRGSAVLDAFRDVLSDGDTLGLTLRFNTYRTAYFGTAAPTAQDRAALADGIAAGGFHPNPARGVMVAVLGPWRRGEPASVPADRVLTRAANGPMSTVFAKLVERRLTLDLANSVPETGFDLPKLDLGPLTVAATTSGGPVALATVEPGAYDRAAYEATSGIVVVPLDAPQAAAARDGLLTVRDGAGAVLLAEQPLTVFAHRPNVYLEEAEAATVELQVLERGARPAAPVSISVAELGGPLPPVVLQTDGDGTASLELNGSRPGSWTYVLQPWRGQAPARPSQLNPELMEYVALRVTPADEALAALEPTWENVYRHVLADFEALAPCMDNWLRLGDEQQCRAYAPLIRALTSRERFDDYRYMPVTRELTKGRRILLHKWCDAVGRPGDTTAAAVEALAGTETRAAPAGAPPAGAPPAPPARDPFGRGF